MGNEKIPTKRLYCGNIPFSSTADDLSNFFADNGFDITDAIIVNDRDTGKSKGFGFVEIDARQAQRAINDLNDEDFAGRRIQVSEAISKALRRNEERDKVERRGDNFRRGGRERY